jgi:hypothetical protein
MAEDLTPVRAPSPQAPPTIEPSAPENRKRKLLVRPLRRERQDGGSRRFLLAYLFLAVVFGGAAVTFGMLVMTGTGQGGGAGDAWSNWKPTATGAAGVEQIASFVSERYRLPSGRQLVAVMADRPLVQNQIPVSTVAIEEGTKDAVGDPNYTLHDTGGDFMYVLCGLGQNCAIPEGTASVQRHRLLRREALELALYTFRYVSGVDSIIAFLPPPRGQEPTSVLFFRKPDFKHHLSRPLRETLRAERPPHMDRMPETERQVIDQLTTKNLFKYEFTQGPDASAILVLKPEFPSS